MKKQISAENKLIALFHLEGITSERIDKIFEVIQKDIGEQTATKILEAASKGRLNNLDDLLKVSGVGEKKMKIMHQFAASGALDKILEKSENNLDAFLNALKLPSSNYSLSNFDQAEISELHKYLKDNSCTENNRYLVVYSENRYYVLDKSHRRFQSQLLHLLSGNAKEKLITANVFSASTTGTTVLTNLVLNDVRHAILLDRNKVKGIVLPNEIIKLAPVLYAGIDVVEKEINTGTSDNPIQYEAIPCGEDCKCAIILFETGGGIGKPIEALTGNKGYSHAAVDCCEKDKKTGERLMIDITLANGVHRTPINSSLYAGRKKIRIELNEEDCRELCNCMKRKVGSNFDWTDFWNEDGEGDPDNTVCSQTIFECLPPRLQERIRNARSNMDFGFWGGLYHWHNPGLISPNQIATAFDVSHPSEVKDGQTFTTDSPSQPSTQPTPTPPTVTTPLRCHVKVRLIRVRFKKGTDEIGTDWLFHFDVNGRGPSSLRSSNFSKKTEPLTPRKLLFDEIKGVCGQKVEINIIIKAWQYDGVNDYGWAETDPPLKFDCPGQRIIDKELKISDWNDDCTLQFRFEVELICK